MIQVVEQPGDVTFSRNNILFRARALDGLGNPYISRGVWSEIRVGIYDGPDTGETITLTWTEPDGSTGTLTFTAVATPTTSLHIPSTSTITGPSPIYTTWTEYYTAVAERMKAHPLAGGLFDFYTFDRGSGQSYFARSIELDDDWVVAFDTSGIAAPHFPVFNTTSVTPSGAPENYRILWEVFLETTYRTGGYQKVGSGEAFLDAESYANWDVAHIIDAACRNSRPNPTIPNYDTSGITLAGNLRRYYVRYREEYDGMIPSGWVLSKENHVIIGGIANRLFVGADWLGGITSATSIFSWRPNGRTVAVDQREYLPWYNYTENTAAVILEYQGFRANGTSTIKFYKYESPYLEARPYETLLIPVGFAQMGETATDIVRYTVRVVDRTEDYEGGTPTYLSPLRTYEIDREYRDSERYIQYLNGFGCPETLRCTGFFSNDLEVERDQAERILAPGYTSTTREVYQHDRTWTNFFTYRTGYLPRTELDALQEMMIEGHIYEIYPTAYIPLQIQSKGMPVTETRQSLHGLTFEAIPALRGVNYSNISLNPEAASGDAWLLTTTGYWLTIFGQRWALT